MKRRLAIVLSIMAVACGLSIYAIPTMAQQPTASSSAATPTK